MVLKVYLCPCVIVRCTLKLVHSCIVLSFSLFRSLFYVCACSLIFRCNFHFIFSAMVYENAWIMFLCDLQLLYWFPQENWLYRHHKFARSLVSIWRSKLWLPPVEPAWRMILFVCTNLYIYLLEHLGVFWILQRKVFAFWRTVRCLFWMR